MGKVLGIRNGTEEGDSKTKSPGELALKKYGVDSRKIASALVKYCLRTGL